VDRNYIRLYIRLSLFPLIFLLDSARIRPLIPIVSKKWPESSGITGRFVPDSVADLNRIHWPFWSRLCKYDHHHKWIA